MLEAAANMYCKPEIKVSVQKWIEDGKTVLEVDVPKSKGPLYYARDKENKWKVYVRVKDRNHIANNVMLKVWKHKKKQQPIRISYSKTDKILLDYLASHQSISQHT